MSDSVSAITPVPGRKLHPDEHEGQEEAGPLKKIIAHQDSLYRYISWEDPIRTLGSYIGALSILLGAHYLPLTPWALKAGAISLGVVSITSFASRSFNSDIVARFRPKEYKQIPESTLNATLKDVHDLVQYVVILGQKIIFCENLDKTFATFIGLTVLYWLIKIATPFSLAVMSLTSVFIAPLITSPRGREVVHDAKASAKNATNTAVQSGKGIVDDGRARAAELSSRATAAVQDTQYRLGNLGQSGNQTTTNVSGVATENGQKLSDTTTSDVTDTANNASNTAFSALSDTNQTINNSLFGTTDGNANSR